MNFHQVSVLKVGNRIPPQVSGCSAALMHGSALAQKPDDNAVIMAQMPMTR